MQTVRRVVLLLGIILSLPGLSFAGTSKTTDSGLFRLEMELEPAKPFVGINSVFLVVTDLRTGLKVEDAVIELIPWMTVHSHGSPKTPAVKKAGTGRYRIDNIFYTMEGDWDLLVTIRNKEVQDSATFSVLNVKR